MTPPEPRLSLDVLHRRKGGPFRQTWTIFRYPNVSRRAFNNAGSPLSPGPPDQAPNAGCPHRLSGFNTPELSVQSSYADPCFSFTLFRRMTNHIGSPRPPNPPGWNPIRTRFQPVTGAGGAVQPNTPYTSFGPPVLKNGETPRWPGWWAFRSPRRPLREIDQLHRAFGPPPPGDQPRWIAGPGPTKLEALSRQDRPQHLRVGVPDRQPCPPAP